MHFDVAYFFALMFSVRFFASAWIVLWVTVLAMTLGIAIGTLGGIVLTSPVPRLHPIVRGYVTFYRGVPVLVQIIFWYNGLTALTGGAINLPALAAGVLALGVNEGAYMTEIVRGGILSVDRGQREAARALTLGYTATMLKVVLPQAMRVALPPTGNEVINTLKNTSLLFTIAVPEIFSTAVDIYSQNFRYFEVLCVVAVWYISIAAAYTVGQRLLERRLNRGRSGVYT